MKKLNLILAIAAIVGFGASELDARGHGHHHGKPHAGKNAKHGSGHHAGKNAKHGKPQADKKTAVRGVQPVNSQARQPVSARR